jgi:hypothetical protein
MLKRDVEQSDKVFCRRRRRISDFGDEGINLKQKLGLSLAHWCQVGPPGPGCVDCRGEPIMLVLKLSPSLVQHRG